MHVGSRLSVAMGSIEPAAGTHTEPSHNFQHEAVTSSPLHPGQYFLKRSSQHLSSLKNAKVSKCDHQAGKSIKSCHYLWSKDAVKSAKCEHTLKVVMLLTVYLSFV